MDNSNFDPILHCFSDTIRRLKCRKSTFFLTPFLFRLKFGVFPLGSAESEKVRLIIAVKLFTQNSNVDDHDASTLQADGQTNGQLALGLAIPRSATLRSAVKMRKIVIV